MKKTITSFRKLIYEPEHTETVCWCNPRFENRDGTLHIVHNEQRDTLTNYILDLVSEKQDELQASYAAAVARKDWDAANVQTDRIAMLNNMFFRDAPTKDKEVL